ncbi:hypothetical protein [Pseudomonas zeae]|uniref:Uncharacterized protein n=1 Tax=Pseudomonas zeae TaxID=2745510 RepID=A0ABU5BJE1_9PSED|nr:hypothetical protein [Pseudomonas zeae]MDX9676626.1 hypothetical protein [Pseudomonas zeae]
MSSILEDLREAEAQSKFIEVLRRLLKSDKNKTEIVEALAELQNNGEIDILLRFRSIDKADIGYEAYFLSLLFNDWLLEISAPLDEILNCVTHIGKLSEGTGTTQALKEYCKKDRARSDSALKIALETPDFYPLLGAILIAGSTHEFSFFHSKALLCLESESDVVRAQALWACAELSNDCDHATLTQTICSIERLVLVSNDEIQTSSALRALISISSGKEREDEALCLTVIEKILLTQSAAIVQAAAYAFATLDIEKQPYLASLLIEYFKNAQTIDSSTLNIISVGLKKYLNPEKFLQAVKLVELIIEKHKDLRLSNFQSFSYDLTTSENKVFLEILITRWLLSDSYKLANSVSDLVAGDGLAGVPISADTEAVKSLPPGSTELLAKKACAYLFMHPISAASYIISLLSTQPQELESVGNTLYYPLGISYPGSVRRYINGLFGPHQLHIQSILNKFEARLTEYHNGLNLANNLEELKPSTAQREIYHRKFHQEMTASFKESRKKSIITQLMGKPSVILYGNSSIHYIHPGADRESIRQETPMHNITTTIEHPSLDYVDHNQLEYLLRVFKIMRIPK